MNPLKLCLLLAALALMSGCAPSYFFTKNVPVLGTNQKGDESRCPKGERVYYYRAEEVAICLPDVMVSYTHCVTELTTAKTDADHSTISSLEVQKILEKVEGVKLSQDQKNKITREFEASGLIGEARAAAIGACLDLTKEVYAKSGNVGVVPQKLLELQAEKVKK
ncbi:hypothetical protein P9K38_16390 [Pseudomonas sp. 905_Psudmo1]|nr:hypothetical protein [Pseudomonas sp. 905_Psudmo1]WFS17027.1 hypothetical protein P9K38_16390 [Pseudomonas sp. 905_Psudmo1]